MSNNAITLENDNFSKLIYSNEVTTTSTTTKEIFLNLNDIEATTSTLDIIINIYNSELNYLKLLKNTFEIYAEPLR
jgi:hypothetical protein